MHHCPWSTQGFLSGVKQEKGCMEMGWSGQIYIVYIICIIHITIAQSLREPPTEISPLSENTRKRRNIRWKSKTKHFQGGRLKDVKAWSRCIPPIGWPLVIIDACLNALSLVPWDQPVSTSVSPFVRGELLAAVGQSVRSFHDEIRNSVRSRGRMLWIRHPL